MALHSHDTNSGRNSIKEKLSDVHVEDLSTGVEPWTSQEETRVRRQIDYRIVPIVFILYLLCFLDRCVPCGSIPEEDSVG
jgi:hypothetical protein